MLPIIGNLPSISRRFSDDIFGGDLFSGFFNNEENSFSIPAVNIKESGNEFIIEVAAPGLNKKDFSIDLDGNVLTISSEKKSENKKKDEKFTRREFNYSYFKRSFTLPESVEAAKIKAKHNDGILNITIPKKEEAKEKPPKKIEIS